MEYQKPKVIGDYVESLAKEKFNVEQINSNSYFRVIYPNEDMTISELEKLDQYINQLDCLDTDIKTDCFDQITLVVYWCE